VKIGKLIDFYNLPKPLIANGGPHLRAALWEHGGLQRRTKLQILFLGVSSRPRAVFFSHSVARNSFRAAFFVGGAGRRGLFSAFARPIATYFARFLTFTLRRVLRRDWLVRLLAEMTTSLRPLFPRPTSQRYLPRPMFWRRRIQSSGCNDLGGGTWEIWRGRS
jgi:hypothetical protein